MNAYFQDTYFEAGKGVYELGLSTFVQIVPIKFSFEKVLRVYNTFSG